jgi:spore maturation protein CgeB
MRIFSAVRHSLDPRYYYGGLWSGMFHPALARLGHDVFVSEVDLKPAWDLPENSAAQRQARSAITEQIVAEVRAAHARQPVDLFLSYFYNAHFDPAGFDEIHRLGIPTVNFYCNSIYQFELVEKVARKATFAWHAEKHAEASYRKAGANPVWVQMAADPEIYRPATNVTRQPKACFIGQRYADRDRLAASLIRAGVPVDLYGSGWGGQSNRGCTAAAPSGAGSWSSYWGAIWLNLRKLGFLGGLARTWSQWCYRRTTRSLAPVLAAADRGRAQDIAETLSAYEVTLNFSNVWSDGRPGSALVPHVRLRDFEGPMCRTCFLTAQSDEIEEFYEVGAEIDTYRTAEELIDKTRFYLSHPAAAERLRAAGHARARRDHTWERRFEELFRKTGIGI